MIDLFGQAHAPANRSRRRASGKGKPMSGTCGPTGSGSSASAALTRLLVSRLQAQLGTGGSMEYSQTWKELATPAGRLYWAHTASARRISDNGCGGWPTPAASLQNDGQSPESNQARRDRLREQHQNGNGAGLTLPAAAQIAGWGSPGATDHKGSAKPGQRVGQLSEHALLAGWNTTKSTDYKNTIKSGASLALDAAMAHGQTPSSFPAAMAGWSSPMAADATKHTARSHQDNLVKQALGPVQPQFPAATEKRGVLNPALARWLMGYPPEWCDCAVMAMQSCQRARRRS